MAETAIATGTAKDLVFMLARIEDEKIYDVVPHRQKRSLNQNAYYWQLLSKVADKLRISKSKLHNDMLRHFGQRMEVDGKPVVVYLPDTEEAENTAMESDTVHLKQTSSTFLSLFLLSLKIARPKFCKASPKLLEVNPSLAFSI